ncbi:hypothetical protein BGZ58_002193 [Dissophora ornata]|nr:hypothetical protein BGZ58_002193 [Dissophora ornata]
MKELYDAKIRRLTEMLEDAGVSPTEVENNLAVVAEATDEKQLSLFDQLVATTTASEHLVEGRGGAIVGRGRRQMGGEEDSLRSDLFEEDECSSIILDGSREGEEEEDLEAEPFDGMSSSGSLTLLSCSTTQLTKPGLSRRPSGAMKTTDTMSGNPPSPTMLTAASSSSLSSLTPKRRTSTSQHTRPFSPTPSDVSTASYPISSRQRSSQQQKQQQKQRQQEAHPDSSKSRSFAIDAVTKNEVKARQQHKQQTHGSGGQQQSQVQGGAGGPSASHESQSPIPSFIADSFSAGTLGMKTLREKWAIASGVLSWNKPKSEQKSITSPGGLFVRQDGIMNDKKPAVVEASIPPPFEQTDLTLLSEKRDSSNNKDSSNKERDIWTSIISPTSRKHVKRSPVQARPMSDIGFLGSHPKYPSMTMARDIPRPPINRIHDYLQRPDSYNPTPLHYRAISMAANMIDTGAITPAKLYARRTQTMIARWTLGLIMNSKPSKSSQSSFPTIRESLSLEQEKMLGHHHHADGNEDGLDHNQESAAGLEMVSSNDRRSGALSPTELPKALSFRNHSSAPSLASSFPLSSSLSFYQSQPTVSTQNVVELSDIGSPPLSMSPTFSYLGDTGCKPLTDRYGFLVNARPMAVQQGLLKLNEAYSYDDIDSTSFRTHGRNGSVDSSNSNKNNGTFEYMITPSDEFERPSSPPPQVCSLYFGHTPVGGVGAFVTGTATTSTTSPSTSVTSPILSTATRPTSTLSPPTSSAATVTTLLSQIKVLHDSVQTTQKDKWDAFLKKRRGRRGHLGETNGGAALANMSSTNLGSPLLFGNLILSSSLEDQEQDDEDIMYWTSMCLIGIATIGKGSDWEEFRDLARGGIPVMYRNKIWQEASGALDMRLPGYYKDLLTLLNPETCQCWGDIDMDLHRTFPTNVLFGPGGQGIEKLKNILLAYSLHNPSVGYCQGMNLLAGTLLLTNNTEEEAFWILTAMLGVHLPEDYFTQQLLSPQADQRVLRELVQEIMPRLSLHFQEMHVDLTAITFSWFLTLFTDCLPVETLLRVWDVFFVEGMIVVFRIAVAILWMNEKEILKCRNGAAVYCFMKQMTMSMHQADKLIKVAFGTLKSYIQPEKIEAKRQKHKRSVRQELIQEQQLMNIKAFACTSPPADKKKALRN